MRIAIVSAREFAGWIKEDLRLLEALEELGAEGEIVPWDEARVDWDRFDGAVIRSIWGYHQHMDAFMAWLDAREAGGLPMANPYAVLRRNIYKHKQMAQLAEQGLPIPPTAFLSRWPEEGLSPAEPSLAASLARHFPGEPGPFVMKPIVSASGRDTVLVEGDPSPELERLYAELLNQRENIGLILQPYLPEVAEGEYALVYIGGEYSHTARRYTGVLTGEKASLPVDEPPPTLRLLADDVMAGQWEAMPAYARVDFVNREAGPLIMELELTEPYLFLDEIPQSELRDSVARRFAEEILAEIKSQS